MEGLEPKAEELAKQLQEATHNQEMEVVVISIALSLRRIADSLDFLSGRAQDAINHMVRG